MPGRAYASPDLARDVFSADPEMFEQVGHLGQIFGRQSVIATSGAVHKRQRKLLDPRFAKAAKAAS